MAVRVKPPAGGPTIPVHALRVSGAPRYLTTVRRGAAAATAPGAAASADARWGCRVPYTQLERITPAQAATRKDVSGCLVMGVAPAGCYGTDVVIEARAKIDTLCEAKGPFSYVTISGLELDTAGRPATLHPIRQAMNGSGYVLDHADVAWINDGWSNASRGRFVDSRIRDHQHHVWRGERQHPDGIQPYGGGDLLVERVEFFNKTASWPINAAGQQVPVSGVVVDKNGNTYAGPTGGASMMFNHDKGYSAGPVIVRDTISHGTASVCYNIAGGATAGDGSTYPGGVEWWEQRRDAAGVLVGGLEMVNNLAEIQPGDVIVRGRTALLRQFFPDPAGDWQWGVAGDPRFGDLGASTAFAIRESGGSLRNVTRRNVITS